MKKKLEPIGKELTKGYEDLQKENAEQAKIVKCPDCKDGWLVVRKSKVGRQFLAWHQQARGNALANSLHGTLNQRPISVYLASVAIHLY